MRKMIVILLLLVATAWADDRKPEMIQQISVADRSPVSGLAADKLMTFNLSPAAWDYLLAPDHQSTALHVVNNFANTLLTVAANMKWGDAVTLDRNTTYDGKNPQVAEMIDGFKPKLSCVVNMPLTDPKELEKAFNNLDYLQAPLTNDYYFHPRGGQAHLVLNFDRKAKAVATAISKDGNTYTVTVPVWADVSQSYFEEQLQRGRAPR